MGIKGCWTCRKRKVRCDSRWPICGNCSKARRVCQGYGIQLSWPRDGDGKRAIISPDTASTLQSHARRFLNSSSWDLSLSEELEHGRIPAGYLRTMRVPRPTYLSPTVINREELHLLGFFNESRSLILGPTDEEVLAQFILRIAFSAPPDNTNPVLQGVFALASLQLHGRSKSFRYKHLMVTSVKEPLNRPDDEKTLLQYLMAMMLLYHYELSLESNSKGSWVVFFCAVKRVINTSPAIYKLIRQEYSIFLDWIYYHEALAEFTVRHWSVPYEGCGYAPIPRSLTAIEESGPKTENQIGCPLDVLQLLVHTCRLAIAPTPSETPHSPTTSTAHIAALEATISHAVRSYSLSTPAHAHAPSSRSTLVSQLHRLAILLYVNRAIHRVSGTELHHRSLVRDAIALLARAGTCQHAWPLFVIGCEASEDEDRMLVLGVLERSELETRRRWSHVHVIRLLVEAVWKQRDLVEAEREREMGKGKTEVEYLKIVDAVVGAVPFMPVFA